MRAAHGWRRIIVEVGADADSFQPHLHPGGEAYLVLKGAIQDHTRTCGTGSLVWNPAGSLHNPRGAGEAVVLVPWPDGVVAGT